MGSFCCFPLPNAYRVLLGLEGSQAGAAVDPGGQQPVAGAAVQVGGSEQRCAQWSLEEEHT